MKKILLRSPQGWRVQTWFYDMFGHPQEWDGFDGDLTQFNDNHQWAYGNTDLIDPVTYDPRRAIWCSDEMYTMYLLRWK